MPGELAAVARARAHRLILIVVITALVELGLYLLADFGPAFAHLVRPVYWVVLGVALVTVWHALRRRGERRHRDRRKGAAPS